MNRRAMAHLRAAWRVAQRRPTMARTARGMAWGIGLGLVLGFAVAPVAARTQTPDAPLLPGRLTARPYVMATGTRNPHAGVHRLDSLPSRPWAGREEFPTVYVPPQCAGSQRCPLLVFVWRPWEAVLKWLQPMADKHGIIVLGPAITSSHFLAVRHLDAVLQYMLRHFAIDPDKLAVMGTCATGGIAQRIGGNNLDVFSRIIFLSGGAYPTDVDPPNGRTEFFADAGILESRETFIAAQALREQGHRVTHAFGFRAHGHQWESYDAVGRWLTKTWAHPDPATRPRPAVLADSLPLLTTDILAKMTAFWAQFMRMPTAIRTTARRAHLREVIVPVGATRPEVVMMDMPALAGRYPAVAEALRTAGLTAAQHDLYRVTLASALVTQNVGRAAGHVDPESTIAQNIAFMETHPDAFQALEEAHRGSWQGRPINMWITP